MIRMLVLLILPLDLVFVPEPVLILRWFVMIRMFVLKILAKQENALQVPLVVMMVLLVLSIVAMLRPDVAIPYQVVVITTHVLLILVILKLDVNMPLLIVMTVMLVPLKNVIL
jgi:hypothetical protein